MKLKGKAIEVIGEKELFGQRIAWIRILEDNTFLQVNYNELEPDSLSYTLPWLRFVSIAAKIKDEVAKKNILAPYESSLIPLPHQVLVLEKVMQSMQNRFLLADEVGMGKTIETGLILKELKLRGEIKRILVIVPKSSMLQWQSELKEHFNEVFHLYDSDMITSMARTFSNINADEEYNFWTQHNQIIVSTDALKPLDRRQGWTKERIDEYNKYRIEAVLDADFDLVVIDEAHKMGGASSTVSRYVLAQELCNTVANVLLLSATPHRGKSDHFRRILQLLDPDAFAGEGLPEIEELEPYVIRTEKRLAVDYDGNKLFNERQTHRFDVLLDINRHQRQMQLYQSVTEYVRKGFNQAKRNNNTAKGLIMILFQRLVSSSTAAILSAMQGRLERLCLGDDNDLDNYRDELDSGEYEYDDLVDFNGKNGNSDSLVDEEQILANLIEEAKACLQNETDAKAEALLKQYKTLQLEQENPELKIIVFTEFRSTQKMLKGILEKKGYTCAAINGSQDLDERKRALTLFKEEAQILIATDAAGESLNMQFCHIVFNYDLPWNPMMIEQRIGRVDRIGQKNTVHAFNMLTNNSVDLRVYEVIHEKLNSILNQLGIDKTSDVLDSTIEMKSVSGLYLRNLLDPEHFEFVGEKWLYEIKAKLRNFQSTEGILPQVQETDIDNKKAAEIKHSPLPQWLESLVMEHCKIQNGTFSKNLLGFASVKVNGESKKVAFDSEVSLNNPGIEHLTLQHDWIRKILNDLSTFDASKGIPVLRFNSDEETPGYFSLWQITAQSQLETITHYQPFFVADNGKHYAAYANDLWSRFISGIGNAKIENGTATQQFDSEKELENDLYTVFQNLEASVSDKMNKKKENRVNFYEYQKLRISKIGIENIRQSKLNRLEKEHEKWMKDFQMNQMVIPSLKQLLTVRIDVR
ncbi:DEAD/DEAH box helicase [Sunxiuqinia rutila]|uniref:DEAD/DEAH box helicase n=1 Tax=Sunxiuqinia rutila TaxID=1397841 RepID=UPI003D36F8F3